MKRTPIIYLLLLPLLAACGQPDRPTVPLYLAVERGDINQIERHIYWESDINRQNSDGRMPLHVAAKQGRSVIAKLLLKHGANINATDHRGHSPLHTALMEGRTQIAQLLIKEGAGLDPQQLLLESINHRVVDRDVMDLLLKNGADINQPFASGETPLISAIRHNDRALVKLLIAHGAEVNRANSLGDSPLEVAITIKNDAIIRLLKRNGAHTPGTP